MVLTQFHLFLLLTIYALRDIRHTGPIFEVTLKIYLRP